MDFSFSFKKPPSGHAQPAKVNPFEGAEEQFNAIRGCGVTPRPKVTFAALVERQDPASFDAAPYAHMLAVMGGFDGSGEPLSDDVWLFDPTAFSEEGNYAQAISHLARLAKGALPLEEISDAHNEEQGAFIISATLDGEAVELAAAAEGGMVSGDVLSTLAAVAAERGGGARFVWADYEGHKIVTFLNEEEAGDLMTTTGMEWSFIE